MAVVPELYKQLGLTLEVAMLIKLNTRAQEDVVVLHEERPVAVETRIRSIMNFCFEL